MARYMVLHGTPAEGTQDELLAVAKKLYASLPGDAEWLNSWWMAGENGKLFCEWEVPDEDAIVALCESVNDCFPVESIHLVTWLDPAWYKWRRGRRAGDFLSAQATLSPSTSSSCITDPRASAIPRWSGSSTRQSPAIVLSSAVPVASAHVPSYVLERRSYWVLASMS